MILLTEFFIPQNELRYKEYLHCLEENIKNNLIKKIVLLVSDNSVCPLKSDKISIVKLKQRPTYTDVFNICNNNFNGEICILSNSDIIFNDTLKHINNNNIINKFVALNRWEPQGNNLVQFRHNIGDSQDCWIFKSPVNIQGGNFHMGTLGCDNRITYLAYAAGMEVINPSEQIITKHIHGTNFRTVSQDRTKTIGGQHLLVFGSKDMDTRSLIIERNWNEFVQQMINQQRQMLAQQQQQKIQSK